MDPNIGCSNLLDKIKSNGTESDSKDGDVTPGGVAKINYGTRDRPESDDAYERQEELSARVDL